MPYHFNAPLLSGVAASDAGLPAPANSPLLAHVGERTKESSMAFALRVVDEHGARLPGALAAAASGEALARAAQEAETLVRCGSPREGDLVVFADGWLFGVVTGVHFADTVEFIYAARGVIRRGFLSAPTPSTRRGPDGRALNTFVRPYLPGDSPEQRYLAGELFTGYIPTDARSREVATR